jgi:general secretion pathway protein E
MGIFELITVGPALRTLIHDRASEHDMERVVRDEVPTLRQAGLALVAAGHTTVEEVLRVTAA